MMLFPSATPSTLLPLYLTPLSSPPPPLPITLNLNYLVPPSTLACSQPRRHLPDSRDRQAEAAAAAAAVAAEDLLLDSILHRDIMTATPAISSPIPDGLADAAAAEAAAAAAEAAEDRLLDSILHRDLMTTATPAIGSSGGAIAIACGVAMGCVGAGHVSHADSSPPLLAAWLSADAYAGSEPTACAGSEPTEAAAAAEVEQGPPIKEEQQEAKQDPADLDPDPEDLALDLDLVTRVQDLEEERDMLAERLLDAGVNNVRAIGPTCPLLTIT